MSIEVADGGSMWGPCVESLFGNVEVKQLVPMVVVNGGASRDHLILMEYIVGIIPKSER